MNRALVLLALLVVVPSARAADPALEAADASWNTLRVRAAIEELDALLVDDWMLTHSDGRVQSKADYLRELKTGSRSNQAIANEDVAYRVYGDAAVVTGTSVQSGVSDGKPWSGRFRFTRVWIREKDRWRMVASHSSRIEPRP